MSRSRVDATLSVDLSSFVASMQAAADAAEVCARHLADSLIPALNSVARASDRAARSFFARMAGPLPIMDGLRLLGGDSWYRPRVIAAWLRAQIDYMDLQVYGALDED